MTIFPIPSVDLQRLEDLRKLVNQLIEPLKRDDKVEIIYNEMAGPIEINVETPKTLEEKGSLKFNFSDEEKKSERFREFKKDLLALLEKEGIEPVIMGERTINKFDIRKSIL